MPKVNKRESKKLVMNTNSEAETSVITPQQLPSNVTYFSREFAPGRSLVYSRYNDRDWIHVREFETLNDRVYPTKKGASFTPARLKALMGKMDEIDEELRQQKSTASYKVEKAIYKGHLGAGIYATVGGKFVGVDLRRYWVPEEQLMEMPTKNGIFLPARQWTVLKERLDELLASHPELLLAEECFHQNQQGMLECHECLPFGWMIKSLNSC